MQHSRDELAALIRRIFGRTSERYHGDAAGQLLLAFDSEDDIEDARAGILQALNSQFFLLCRALHKRKNWLFVGSVPAGHRAASLMTLVSSALRNHLDVWAYVKGVIDALLTGETNYQALRPDVWAATHPDQIRHYRIEERRDRADRKQRHQAARRQPAAPQG